MFNFIKKNITFLQRLFKIQQTREMPTTPTRDINFKYYQPENN